MPDNILSVIDLDVKSVKPKLLNAFIVIKINSASLSNGREPTHPHRTDKTRGTPFCGLSARQTGCTWKRLKR